MFALMIFFLVGAARPEPSPFEMPKSSLRKYFENADNDAKVNPIPYDAHGTPPDNFPIIIPGDSDYYDNETYPGPIWDEIRRDCHTVDNCPGSFGDPYAPILSIGDYVFPFNPVNDRELKCNKEADCFGQDRVPDDLANDTEVLFLRSSNFTSLNIGDLDVLPPLIKLRIEYSDLRTIQPRVFESQPTLQALELVGNALTSLAPSTFLELVELTSLDLTSNKIAEINRRDFEGLDALTELRIISNSLIELGDDTFREMASLETITLEYNNISVIYKYAFRGLPKLKKLYLNHNSLRSVPTLALRVPTGLTNLYLTGNPLRNIFRKDFRGVENLVELWLDECEIATIAKNTFQGSSLQVLVISDNSLTFLPNLGRMKQLRAVVMEYNPWICDCAMVRTIKWLKRHSIGPESQEPTCAAPEHLAGRRALELYSDDLCVERIPLIVRTLTPETTATSPKAGDSSDSGDDETMPEGGWSLFTYKPRELYTTSEKKGIGIATTKPTPSSKLQSTATLTTDESTEKMDRMTTQKPRSTTEHKDHDHDLTSRGTDLEWTSAAGTHEVREGQATDRQTKAVESISLTNSTELIKRTEETTESDTDTKTLRPNEATYSIIAVISVVLLVMVIGAVVFKVFLNKESKEKGDTNSNYRMELATANGTAPKAVNHEKSHTDRNANSHSKPDPEVGTEFSEEGT